MCAFDRKVCTSGVTENLLFILQGQSQLMQMPWVPYQKDGSKQPLKKVKCISSIIRQELHRGLTPGYVSIFALGTVRLTVSLGSGIHGAFIRIVRSREVVLLVADLETASVSKILWKPVVAYASKR